MFKLESYITPLLMGYLDKYVKLRTEDFQLSLWGGDAVLYNLDLRLDVLEKAMQLPIVFQSGHIHELRLHVPWTKLGSEPVVVTINTIECILKLRDTAYSDKGSTRGGSEVSSRKSGSSQRQKARRQDAEDLPPGYLQSLMNKIVNNVCLIVNNLIIKFVEDDIVFSMNMKSAECYSVNKDWVRAFVELTSPDFILRRAINICDLTMCLDKRDGSGRIENYQDPLIYRCSVSSRLYMKYDSINAKYPSDTKLDFYCDKVDLSMTDTQLPMFIRLVELGLALYYGTLEFKTIVEPEVDEPEKQKMSHEEQTETAEASSSESESEQGWGQWAWSFVPQILPDDESVTEEVEERKRPQPSVFSLGTYAYKMSVTFKLTEHTKEKAHYGPRKVSFKPFLYLESEGISMEVVMQGLLYFDVQFGVTNLRIFSQGNCICGARSEENFRNNIILSGGDSLPNKTVSNYLTQSLFDSHSARNLGIPSERVLDWEHHLEVYTEQHAVEQFGVIWTDYLYVMTKNEERSVHSSRSSTSEHEETSVFAKENSLSRFVIGQCHLNVASTTFHRVQKLLNCAYKYDYEPYAKKHAEIVDDNRPHPTEEQMKSMEEFVPTRTYHLTLLRPIISLLSAEHAHCDIAKKTYHSKLRSSRGESSTKLYPLFGIQMSSERFDLQIMSAMYPRNLVQLVSKIAGPPSSLLHHCYSHTQMKLFGFHVGLTAVDVSGTRSPLLTVVPTTSGALYTRKLLLPVYWKNSYLPKIERVYELPQITMSLSKAGLLVVIEILSSWQQKNPRPSDVEADTLLEDVFPQGDSEIEKKSMPMLDLTMAGFEMKTCRNDLVSACSGTLSSAQVLMYTSDGGSSSVTPILSSSTDTENLHTSDWLTMKDASVLEDKNDCFTFTYQLPRKYDQIEAPAVVLVNMEGVTACLDPVLLEWLQYSPRQKVVLAAEKKIELDLELAKAASPLQGNISQVSQASSGSTRQHTDSLTITHSLTPRTQTASVGETEKRVTETSGGWGERLAKIFPLVRHIQVQVEVKKLCLFLPKTHLQVSEPSVNIPQNLHRLARSRSLPDTLVLCLPHVTIQSAGHKPISPLQEIPINSMDGSLVGDKTPWNVSLKNFSVYTLHQQSNSPWKALQLVKPATVSSTVGVSYKYNPPTSDDISALGLCLHTDMHNVTACVSAEQVVLIADLSGVYSKLGGSTMSLVTDITKKMITSDKTASPAVARLPPTPEPVPERQTLTSVTSHTDGDGLVTETSYDLGSMDTTPSRELEILESVSGGVKLSLWLQWTLPRCELRLYCLGKEDQKLNLLLEDITMSIDVNDIYSKLKMNLGAANIGQFIRNSSTETWQKGPKNGIIMSCRGDLSHDTHILSTRLWSADHQRGASSKATTKLNSNQRDVTHGFMNLTFTRALRKNVKKKFQKLNIDIPTLQDTQTDKNVQYYFHKYVSEICVTVSPCDFVICFSAIQGILGSFGVFESGQKSKQTTPRIQSPSKSQMEKKNTEPKPFLTSSNLPLIYADVACVRVFIPRERSHVSAESRAETVKTTLEHNLLMMQIQSITMSPQADNPLPRYPIRKDLWQRAVQLGVTSQPGSALLDRQYQIDLSGLSLSTGCWEEFVTKATASQPPPAGTPGTQIPALEWNVLPSFHKDHDEIQLSPIVSACEVKLVAAPSVVHILPSLEEVLVCGHSVEFNITSDLDLHTSTNQIHLVQRLVSDSVRSLSPPSDSSYELLDDKDSVKDSGIGSDISASTLTVDKRSKVKDTSEASSGSKVNSSKVMTPFNILLTAGRISCMVYSHKIAEADLRLGEPHRKSDIDKKSTGHKFEWKVDSDVDSDLGGDEGYEHIEAEAEFEEFSFMNIHDPNVYESEVKVIPHGSTYVQPFLYFYISQPHMILSCQTEAQKFEMSCYDILVKGPTENALFQVTESKLLPDCSDYTVYWLETRAGQPHPTTGIPPSLYTLTVTDFLKGQAGFILKFERPVKLNLSLTKLEQIQQLVDTLFPQREPKRSRITPKDQSSKSSESTSQGVYVILNKMKHFELQTDQVVVSMETQSCDHSPGLNASFTSFSIEADLQHNLKGELDNVSSTTYLRDVFVQTKYDRRLSSLLGPFSMKIDGTFSHSCYDSKHFLSQSLVTIATGLVVINVGQEHVLCLDLIAKHIKDTMKDISSTTSNQSGHKVEKKEPVSQLTEDFVVHKSVDDLKSGRFQYRIDSDSTGIIPYPGEIIFCDKDKDGNSSMTWSYSHPRLISYIQSTPVPFSESGDDQEERTRVYCTLQYWEELVQQFVDYADLEISETDVTTADLPDVRTASSRDLMVSTVWRLVINNIDRQPVVLPASLAASVKIDSCFIPSLIPSLQVGCTLESVQVHLSNHLHCVGTKSPTKLEPFYTNSCGPASEEFAVLTIDNILIAGSQFGGQQTKTSLQFSAQLMLDVLEYKMLTMQKLLAPCDISGVASVQPKPKPAVIDCDVTCDSVDLKVGRGVVHTLTTALQAWNQTITQLSAGNQTASRTSNQTGSRAGGQTGSRPGNQDYQPLFGHYVLCNDTQQPIRFGQTGTDENLVLQPREMQSYSWRSHKVKQTLHVCVDGATWKWCQPFNITNTGTIVRKVTSSDQSYTLIIKITRLSNVQNQIVISGQLHFSNRLDLPVEVKVISNVGSHDHRSIGHPGHTIPSYIMELSEIQAIKFHCPGRGLPWSKEVFIGGEKLKENNLVKLHLPDKKSFHVWCRVFTQNVQTAQRILVVLCPLYVVRSHLPCPVYINIDTSKLNTHRQIEAHGRGSDLQLQCAGGDIHHAVTFQFSKKSAKSSSGVTLSTGLIDQLTRSAVKDTEFDNLYGNWTSVCQHEWPYCREPADKDPGLTPKSLNSTHTIAESSETQPTIDLNISLSELWGGCNTVLIDVTPWCLFTNLCNIDLVLMGAEDRTFQVSKGCTFSPPKLEGSFHIGVRNHDKVYMSAPIPVSEEEIGAQRYRNDVGKTLYLDSWVHMAVFTEHQSQVYFLTITSSVQHQIRTVSVRERYCLTNYTKLDLSASVFSVPQWSDKVSVPQQPNYMIPRNQTHDPDVSDLQCLTFVPVTVTKNTKSQREVDHNTDFILYLSFQDISLQTDVEKSGLQSDWSFPIRLTANENGCRMTGNVQLSKGSNFESKPLCITGHMKKGVTYFVIKGDTAPACLVKNKCPFRLVYGQTLVNLTMSGATIQEQTELVHTIPTVESGREVYYTPPSLNSHFPEITDKQSFPKLHLSGITSNSSESFDGSGLPWSKPVDLLVATDTFVKIPDLADVRVHVQHVALVTHVTIEPITKAEVSAKEIRSRLKGKETTIVVESKHFDIGNDIFKEHKEVLTVKSRTKEESNEDSKSAVKSKGPVYQYNVGLFVKQFSVLVQDELSSHETQGELLRLSADDIFVAWYPVSAMIEDSDLSRNCIVVSAGDLQLDNQLHDQGKYDFPVVLVRQNYERLRTVHDYEQLMQMNIIEKHAILKSTSVMHAQVVLSSFKNSNSVIESVELTAKPLSFYVDDTFIFRVIKEVEGFIATPLSLPEALPVTLLKLPQSVKSSSKTGSCPVRIGHLSIEQLSILMSVHASLKLFIASDHTPLTFGAFEKSNLCTTGHQLTRVIVMHYASGALFKAATPAVPRQMLTNGTSFTTFSSMALTQSTAAVQTMPCQSLTGLFQPTLPGLTSTTVLTTPLSDELFRGASTPIPGVQRTRLDPTTTLTALDQSYGDYDPSTPMMFAETEPQTNHLNSTCTPVLMRHVLQDKIQVAASLPEQPIHVTQTERGQGAVSLEEDPIDQAEPHSYDDENLMPQLLPTEDMSLASEEGKEGRHKQKAAQGETEEGQTTKRRRTEDTEDKDMVRVSLVAVNSLVAAVQGLTGQMKRSEKSGENVEKALIDTTCALGKVADTLCRLKNVIEENSKEERRRDERWLERERQREEERRKDREAEQRRETRRRDAEKKERDEIRRLLMRVIEEKEESRGDKEGKENSKALKSVLGKSYTENSMKDLSAVVGSLEILGNPTGLVRSIGTGVADFFRMPYRGLTRGPGAFVVGISSGTSSMVKNITTGMLTSITNFASSVSRNMDRLSMDSSHQERQEETRRHRPDGVSEGLIQGLTGLGLSVLGAIAGLADQPIRNIVAQQTDDERGSSKTAAAGSLVTGVGKGLVGVITKPIGGAAEFVSQTGQGILHGTGLSKPPKPRSSNSFPPVSEGSCGQTKYAQKLLQSIPSCDILFYTEAGYVDITDVLKPVTLILTPEILFVINHEDDIQQQAFAVAELECGVKMDETAVLTIIWRDSFTDKLDEPGLTNEERVAAFIDSTIPLARVRRDSSPALNKKEGESSPVKLSSQLNSLQLNLPKQGPLYELTECSAVAKQHGTLLQNAQDSAVAKQQGTLLQLAEASAVARQQGTLLRSADAAAVGQQINSVILEAQLSDSDSNSSVIGDSVSMATIPQYDFHVNAPQLATFLAVFNITKRKLQGSGFAL